MCQNLRILEQYEFLLNNTWTILITQPPQNFERGNFVWYPDKKKINRKCEVRMVIETKNDWEYDIQNPDAPGTIRVPQNKLDKC